MLNLWDDDAGVVIKVINYVLYVFDTSDIIVVLVLQNIWYLVLLIDVKFF